MWQKVSPPASPCAHYTFGHASREPASEIKRAADRTSAPLKVVSSSVRDASCENGKEFRPPLPPVSIKAGGGFAVSVAVAFRTARNDVGKRAYLRRS